MTPEYLRRNLFTENTFEFTYWNPDGLPIRVGSQLGIAFPKAEPMLVGIAWGESFESRSVACQLESVPACPR